MATRVPGDAADCERDHHKSDAQLDAAGVVQTYLQRRRQGPDVHESGLRWL